MRIKQTDPLLWQVDNKRALLSKERSVPCVWGTDVEAARQRVQVVMTEMSTQGGVISFCIRGK
jgi:hypothetical protein